MIFCKWYITDKDMYETGKSYAVFAIGKSYIDILGNQNYFAFYKPKNGGLIFGDDKPGQWYKDDECIIIDLNLNKEMIYRLFEGNK